MQMNDKLTEKVTKAVEVSMRIEGYPPTRSRQIKEEAKRLMERRRVQVSVSGK